MSNAVATKVPGKSQSGPGTSKKSSEIDHNAIRRAKKAKQRKNHRSQAACRIETFTEGLAKDRRAKRDEMIERKQQRQFRQADLALQSPAISKLAEGSLAHSVAVDIVKEFPAAQPTNDLGKTQVAVETVLLWLDPELRDCKATRLGISVARTALRGAFSKLSQNTSASI